MSSHLFGGNSLVHQPANLIFLDPWTLDPSNIRSIPMVSLLAVPFSDLWKAPCHRKWKFIVQTVYVQQFPIFGDHWCPNETKTLSPSLEVTEKLSQVTKNCQGTCGGFLWNHFWRDRWDNDIKGDVPHVSLWPTPPLLARGWLPPGDEESFFVAKWVELLGVD